MFMKLNDAKFSIGGSYRGRWLCAFLPRRHGTRINDPQRCCPASGKEDAAPLATSGPRHAAQDRLPDFHEVRQIDVAIAVLVEHGIQHPAAETTLLADAL